MKKVLIIGSSGMVASRFVDLTKSDFNITAIDEKTLDITDRLAVENYFSQNSFDVVINFAAYTDVAGAETQWNDENGLCYRLNVLAPKYLSEVLKKHDSFLIHFSTDFAFDDSEIKGPFDEEAQLPSRPDNLCWYGWTKNRGEIEVVKSEVKNAIVRIANPFRSNYPQKLDFARKILDLYDKNSLFPLFTDQEISPLFVDDLVKPLSKIINQEMQGIFHLVSSDIGTYFDVGSYILEKARGVKNVVKGASLVEFMKTPGRNKRPIFGGLATVKTQEKLGMKFRTWCEMVDEFVDQLKQN